jgi:predicted phosphohydrolase
MRLQIASDLHLEFPENRDFIALNPLQIVGDILLLAGDIVPLLHIDRYRGFFDLIADNYEQTYWVPGNHEYYHFDIANKSGAFKESIRSNVTLLNNCSIELNDIHLHFTSLWSNISKTAAPYIQRGLTDFQVIKCEGQRLSVEKYNQMYAESVAFLGAALNTEKTGQIKEIKNIIITHHVPTYQHYPAKYIGSILNEAFATDLDEFVESSGADYWIYGHHHATTGDFNIGKTKLVTNQLGYVHHNEHREFDTGKVLAFDTESETTLNINQ